MYKDSSCCFADVSRYHTIVTKILDSPITEVRPQKIVRVFFKKRPDRGDRTLLRQRDACWISCLLCFCLVIRRSCLLTWLTWSKPAPEKHTNNVFKYLWKVFRQVYSKRWPAYADLLGSFFMKGNRRHLIPSHGLTVIKIRSNLIGEWQFSKNWPIHMSNIYVTRET